MRPTLAVLAAVISLSIGVAATWFVMRRAEQPAVTASTAPAAKPAGEKKVLYWYDPMAPGQRFDKPGKSPYMDMPLVPKYADSANDGAGVFGIDPREVQNLGVRTAFSERGLLSADLRVTGTVVFDERAVSVVQARVAGIVEQLAVRAPLTPVKQGQLLLTLLAPDWTAAQQEYLSLRRMQTPGLAELRAAARQRLTLLGMSDAQIRAIERSGQAQVRIAVTAPQDGVVGELAVREGASVMPGTPLLRINGLDTVWINAAIPEAQAGGVTTASVVEAEVPAFPGERFSGKIETLLPDVDAATRTQTARIVLRNPAHRLAPGMFARVQVTGSNPKESVLVPTDAVITTGARALVIVAEGEGRFRAQEVRVGSEAGGKTQILDGLADGEKVVLSGQFLIDSEASLTGALARLEGSQGASAEEQTPPKPHAHGGNP